MNSETTRQLEFDLVPTHLAIQAMRDNGYNNTAHAVAELIDNAIQAGASHVELLCEEDEVFVTKKNRRRIQKIAVLDNGSGMDEQTLRMALQFGNGTRLDDRTGIGRFGMGLPSASISQCRQVDVWTWTEHPDECLHTAISLDEIGAQSQREVPIPQVVSLPKHWRDSAEHIGQSGTLVVWSNLDRCMWRTAKTIIDRSEYIIGRMYRRFLHRGEVTIRMAAFLAGDPANPDRTQYAEVNDPLYLMTPSSTPEPYKSTPMFEPDGECSEVTKTISTANGHKHEVTIRFAVAKDEVRAAASAGATRHGKHARDNVGISLVRANRELELDQSLVNTYDPRERWWGVEVEFPPALDELFGVTNNKQSARNFSDVAENLENLLSDDKSVAEIKDEIEAQGDPTGPLIDVIEEIDRRLKGIRKAIKIQAKGQSQRGKRHETSPEKQATDVTRAMQAEGHRGSSDEDESLPPEERRHAIRDELIDTGVSLDDAEELSFHIIDHRLKYTFSEGELDGRSFFTVKNVAGEIVIKLNINHPAYEQLLEVLHSDVDAEADREELLARLQRAHNGLKLLLMAWARFEDEEHVAERRELLQDMRTDWGRVAARFLRGQ